MNFLKTVFKGIFTTLWAVLAVWKLVDLSIHFGPELQDLFNSAAGVL